MAAGLTGDKSRGKVVKTLFINTNAIAIGTLPVFVVHD
jgi:hypothetical protein